MSTRFSPAESLRSISAATERLAIRAALRPRVNLIPALVIAYTCLLPSELAFEIGGIDFRPTRVATLVMFPFVLVILKREPLKFSSIDLLAFTLFAWYSVAAYAVDGFPTTINRGLAASADQALIYLIGRVSIRSHYDIQKLLILLLPGLTIVGLIVMVESVLGQHLLRPMLAKALGQPYPSIQINFRLGLLRGVGPFYHPILAGLFLSAFFPLYWGAMQNLPRLRKAGLWTGFLSIFTLSSAPLLALVMSASAIGALALQRRLRIPVLALCGGAVAMGLVALQAVSQNGALNVLLRYMTLSTSSARFRTFIWEYGWIEVMANPVFGIGARDWDRPSWIVKDSVDAYWLFLSMFYGLPAAFLGLLFPLLVIFALGRSAKKLPISPAKDIQNGIIICLGAFIFCGFTVHLWDTALVLYLLIIAFGVSLSQAANARAHQMKASAVAAQKPNRPQRMDHHALASLTP